MTKSLQTIINEHDYGLNQDQQNFIKDNYGSYSLKELAQKVHKNPLLNERSQETKKISLFITKIKRDHDQIELDEQQREEVRKMAQNMGPHDIAKVIFQNNSLSPLSKEVRTIDKYIKIIGISNELAGLKLDADYTPPKAISRLIMKVNRAKAELDLKEETLTGLDKKFLEQLRIYLNNQRFVSTINTMSKQEEKDLFESEFINGVYGKELNSEDVNMYISLCMDYVLQKQIKKQLDVLDSELESATSDEDKGIKIALVEAFGKKGTEFDQCSKRIKSLQEALSQNYSKRMGDKASLNSSLVAYVEIWKDEIGRKRMIMIAEATKQKVSQEIDRLEDEQEFVAKIMGISREEILNG